MDYETRHAAARSTYNAGLERVKTTPEPEGQEFPCESRVRIADDLGSSMDHFLSGKDATVKYVYAHAYGGSDVESYCLDIDGHGEHSWYYGHQLSAILTLNQKTMKTNEDEKNLIIDMVAWLPKMLSGKTLEAVYSDGSTETVTDVSCLIKDIKAGLTFRIKAIAFPDAPDGEQWHNPSNYSPEFLEVDNGWRLLLTSEVWGNHLKTRCQGVQTSGEWGEGFYGVAKRLTYRVKTSEHPVGSLKPKVEPKQMTLPRHLMHKDGTFVMVYDGCLHWIGDHVKNPTRDMWIEYDREELTNLLLRVPKGGVTLIDSGYNRSIKGGTFADECQHHEIIEDISKGFQKLGYLPENSFELAIAIMDGRVSKHIRVKQL